jgi:hypothetical protein
MGRIELALSIQALHELTNEQKQALFQFVQRSLAEGGYYLIIDRFTIPAELEQIYSPLWDFLEETTSDKSGKSLQDYAQCQPLTFCNTLSELSSYFFRSWSPAA